MTLTPFSIFSQKRVLFLSRRTPLQQPLSYPSTSTLTVVRFFPLLGSALLCFALLCFALLPTQNREEHHTLTLSSTIPVRRHPDPIRSLCLRKRQHQRQRNQLYHTVHR